MKAAKTGDASQAAYKRSAAYVFLRNLIKPLWGGAIHRLAVRKYAHHADSRSFDWDWKAVNYNRIALVNLLVSKFRDPAYLEIGCASNNLFDSVPVVNKVGVDPASGGTVRKTSDEFFAQNKSKFDVVFIDGLHTYDQVRRDIQNAIDCLRSGGWIVLHDLLPHNWIEHHTPNLARPSDAWTGDVWKAAFELAQTTSIDFKIILIDCGVGVFRLEAPNVELVDLRQELQEKEFSYYYENIQKLPLTSWEAALPWLRGFEGERQ